MLNNNHLRLLVVAAATLLGGCLSTPDEITQRKNNTTETQSLLAFNVLKERLPDYDSHGVHKPNDIFFLSARQSEAFLKYYHSPHNAHIPGHKRLAAYIEKDMYGFTFLGKTQTASKTMETMEGNCLSLAILTKALANLVNIDVEYQLVHSAPVYQRKSGIITLSSHVRTHLVDPHYRKEKDFITIFKPKVIIDYFPQKNDLKSSLIDESAFISMYYQNKAAEALLSGKPNDAYNTIQTGLQFAPQNPEALNTLAVTLSRLTQSDLALVVYNHIQKHTHGSTNATSNYANLLQKSGQYEQADLLRLSVSASVGDNPYEWIDLANQYLAKDKILLARKYFALAIDKAPYLHEGHFGLAKVLLRQNKPHAAKLALEEAKKLSRYDEEQKLYTAKLEVLNNGRSR